MYFRRQKGSKYKNTKVEIDGIKFDSKSEAKRYQVLKILVDQGEITKLQLQPRFLLQESFKKNGKTFRKIEYIADFMYEENGEKVVEDVKGMQTDVFKLKMKMFEYKYPELTLKITK